MVSLMMTCYSEKIMFHSQLEKKSWMVFILYSPISHLSPESLAKHIHFPVFLSQIWSVVLSLGQLQAVKNQGQNVAIDCVMCISLTFIRNIHNFQHDIFDCWKFNCPVQTNHNLIKETSIWSSLIEQYFIWKKNT